MDCMPIYNKLVRDYIPTIIEEQGKKLTARVLDEEEYQREMRRKSREELGEYLEAATDADAMEELADLLEIIHALSRIHGTDISRIEEIRKKKAEERGGFGKRMYLVNVED